VPLFNETREGEKDQTLCDVTHTDIDYSFISIAVIHGQLSYVLYEGIWSEPTHKVVETPPTSYGAAYYREVDSKWFDGDHRLVVTATTGTTDNPTEATIQFESGG
jgi:hypothetical protein